MASCSSRERSGGQDRAQLGEPVAFGPQLSGGQSARVQEIRGVGGQGLAAVTGKHPGQQLLGRPRLPGRMGAFVVGAERLGADGQVQVGALGAAGELDIAALHVLGAVQGQQRPLLGAALGAHVGPGIGQVDPPRLARLDGGVQVPAGQPDRLGRLILQGPDGHRPAGHVQVLDDGGGAVDHAQAVGGVGAQHHHIPDREAPVPDGQPLGAELARLGPQPLADRVELVDLGAAVAVDHRVFPGLMGLPPVVDEGAVAVVAGLEGADAVMLGIGGDRLLQVAGAHVVDRPLLPGLDLPPVHGQLGGAQSEPEGAEAATGGDGGELAVVADQHHLGPRPLRMAEQGGELAGADHGGLVHHQHRPAV